jgi:hypothetical protein
MALSFQHHRRNSAGALRDEQDDNQNDRRHAISGQRAINYVRLCHSVAMITFLVFVGDLLGHFIGFPHILHFGFPMLHEYSGR